MHYQLLNNHYIVTIDKKKYLIDTGRPDSFVFDNAPSSVIINDQSYDLGPNTMDQEATEATMKLVGEKIDGFISARIIAQTGLTIYKNGELFFENRPIDGRVIPFDSTIEVVSNGIRGRFYIDTGAKYGYMDERLIPSTPAVELNAYDFNPHPRLRHMHTNMYEVPIEIDGRKTTIVAGYNKGTINFPIGMRGIILIGNITTLFDEACVVDLRNGRLILK